MKLCSKCGGSLGERSGKQRYCKACHAEYMRNTRPKHSELSEHARLKANARALAKYGVKKGIITRKPCEVCGDVHAEMHHPDHSKPYDVVWLCRPHHLEIHRISA